jgi:hypothetical protein
MDLLTRHYPLFDRSFNQLISQVLEVGDLPILVSGPRAGRVQQVVQIVRPSCGLVTVRILVRAASVSHSLYFSPQSTTMSLVSDV